MFKVNKFYVQEIISYCPQRMRHHVEESHLSLLHGHLPHRGGDFFTTLMQGGVPTDMPVGIVDQDNSHTSRQLVHKLDAFQTTKVVAHYENIAEARHAIQKNEIYAFMVIPNGTEAGLMASQPAKDFLLLQQRFAGSRLPALPRLEDHSHPGRRGSRNGEAAALGKTQR